MNAKVEAGLMAAADLDKEAIYKHLEAMTAQIAAERQQAKDAARYRWLVKRFTGYDFYWGGDELICAVFEVGDEFRGGRDISSAIDAQIAKE